MKRILCIAGLLSVCVMPLSAQTTNSPDKEFHRHWQLQLQGGAGYTVGEADFGKLISPSAAISAGYRFTPVWGLRVGVSGWEGKGAWLIPEMRYKFNFMQVNADVMVDLANWIGGYKFDRVVNPYVFLGVGGNFAFNNDQAQAVDAKGYKMGLLWDGCKPFVAGRAGVGVDFRVSRSVSVGLEVNTNMLPDKFNSKKAYNVDWQMNLLAGVTIRFNKCGKKTAAPVQSAMLPMPAAEEPVAVVMEPVEPVVAPSEAVAEVPAVLPVEPQAPAEVVEAPAAEKSTAPAPPSPDTYKVRQDVFFEINSFKLRSSEDAKMAALVESLKANPTAKISIVGYADAPTGNSEWNYWLSGLRAVSVRDALKAKGIAASRIKLDFKGDREQPYSDVEDNRVVICIVR